MKRFFGTPSPTYSPAEVILVPNFFKYQLFGVLDMIAIRKITALPMNRAIVFILFHFKVIFFKAYVFLIRRIDLSILVYSSLTFQRLKEFIWRPKLSFDR